MDAALKASLALPVVRPFCAVKIELAAENICLAKAPGFTHGGDEFTDLHPVYGALDTVSGLKDNIEGQVPQPVISIMPATETGRINLQAFTAQSKRVRIWMGNWDYENGQPYGALKQEFIGRFDRPEQSVSPNSKSLTLHCITSAALAFEAKDHRRASDSFHQSAHPGERGFENLPLLQREIFWRLDDRGSGNLNTSGTGGTGGGSGGGSRGPLYHY